ncbi:hypothetical protein ACFO4E_28040 [Nocardiopsis mangrovi]|uniref:Uncharacterized protein n=1 Tax=Nocardiopsis mangrovi TaxID=1179818 RepID=A0ABV9E4Y2_9ACTN
MSGDSLFVGPDLMKKYGGMLHEPADGVEKIFADYESGRSAFGEKPWGHGDEMADVFEDKFVPAEGDLLEFGVTLVDVLRETADNTIYTAERYRRADLGNEEIANNLYRDLPDSPGDLRGPGGPGGLPGGRPGRG